MAKKDSELKKMKPAPFDLCVAQSVKEVVSLLKQNKGDAKILAGGQSLMAMLNMRLVKPNLVIDISRIKDLDYIKITKEFVEIGATFTQSKLENWPKLQEIFPIIASVLPHVGHFQTRNRGTVCGSVCHSDPSSELPLLLALLNGEVVLSSTSGTRIISAKDFQTGMLSTACETHEFVTAIRFPIMAKKYGHAFIEIARRHGDYAIVALAAIATKDSIKLGVGGVADIPSILELKPGDLSNLSDALNTFAWSLDANDDIHASAKYRREIVRRLGESTLRKACNEII